MKSPVVSRQTYEDALASRDAEIQRLTIERDKLTARLDHFTDVQLTASEAMAPKPVGDTKPDPVMRAIGRMAKGNIQLRKHYFEYVNEARSKGTDEEQIAADILAGVDDMDGVP